MKLFHLTLMVAVSAFLMGCDEGTRGGPGATDTNTTDATDTTVETTTTTDPVMADPATTTTTTTTDDVVDPAPTTTVPPATTDSAPLTPATTSTAPAADSEDTFTLDLPNFSTDLKQGETEIVSVGIAREDKFDDEVTLEFQNLPKGVTIDPAKPTIKQGDKEAKVTVKAAADAALGDHAIKVIGHPTKGKDATNELNITVSKP